MLRFPTHGRLAADSRDAGGCTFYGGSDVVPSTIVTPASRPDGAAVGRQPA